MLCVVIELSRTGNPKLGNDTSGASVSLLGTHFTAMHDNSG